MSITRMAEVWKLDLPTSPKMVLLALADCANDDGGCWPSMATIAEKASMSLRTAQGCIKILVEGGFLDRDERAGKGCFYTVLPQRDTPAKSAPRRNCAPQKTTQTPADSADKPSRTIIDDKAKASSSKRAAARRDAGGDERVKRKAERAAAKAAWVKPDWADPQVWADLLIIREGKMKAQAFTTTAYLGVIRRCEQFGAELGQSPGEILRECVERGWAGIFNPMESDNGGAQRAQQNRIGRQNGGPACGQFDNRDGFQRELDERIAARRPADGGAARGGEFADARPPALPQRPFGQMSAINDVVGAQGR